MVKSKAKVVLIADDSADDLLFYKRILTRIDRHIVVRTARDGEDALEYLRRAHIGQVDCPMPDILILDLKMPRKGGFDVLADFQRLPELRVNRVLVLSSSALPEDARRALELGADGFFTKVNGLDELKELFTAILNNSNISPPAMNSNTAVPLG